MDRRLEGLRAATRDVHERLHLHPAFAPLMATPANIAGYARLIGQLHGFYTSAEAWLFAAAERLLPELVDLQDRRKAHLLQEDMSSLASFAAIQPGIPLGSAQAILGGMTLQGCLTRPTLLGCLYVTEGATLGGRELGRKVAPALHAAGLAGAEGRRFFLAYGARQGDMWRQFCTVLGDAAARFTQAECGAMEAAARDLFLTMETWLTQTCTTA